MEKKGNNGKNQNSFIFDYQELIEKNNLDVSELPEMMAEMIHTTDKHLKEALSSCTDGHCTKVIAELQPYADFILDELYNHYDQLITDNHLEDDQDEVEVRTMLDVVSIPEKVEPKPQRTDEQVILECTRENQEGFTEEDLRKRGFKGALTNRYVKVGDFVLKKVLFQPYWEILPSSEIIAQS